MSKKLITRREFLRNSSAAACAGAIYIGAPVKSLRADDPKTKVVLIREKNILDSRWKPRADLLENMLDKAVTELLGVDDPGKAWQQLIKPDDIVGIKSNEWSRLATPPELENVIKNRMLGCGVSEKNISIGDRRILSDDVFLKANALINVRPMRTHDWSGVGSLLKNYIMFVKNPSDYHNDSCADLAKLWKLPLTEGKTRLNILVMLTPLFHSVGPHNFNPAYIWPYNGLIVGLDPVAVDATGVRIIQAKRHEYFGEEKPINPPPKHIFLADTRHHLGVADPNKIDLVRSGWQEDILI